MMTNDKTSTNRRKFSPEKLIFARQMRGLNSSDLAKELELSRAAVSKYETGVATPSAETLMKLIQVLRFPMKFFMEPFSWESDPRSEIIFRSLQTAQNKQRIGCLKQAEFMGALYRHLRRYVKIPAINLPEQFQVKQSYSDEEIENAAQEIRRIWNVSDKPIANMTNLLESNGIPVVRALGGSSKIDAFSCYFGERPFVFLAAYDKTAVRQRFDEAHELGHIVLHGKVDEEQLFDPKKLKRMEGEANSFAAAFLLPKESFSDDLYSTRLDFFISLKGRWKTSVQCMIMRANKLGYVTDDQKVYLQKLISRNKYRTFEPLDDSIPHERPMFFRKMIALLLDRKVLDREELTEAFKVSPADIEDMLFLDRGTLAKEGSGIIKMEISQP